MTLLRGIPSKDQMVAAINRLHGLVSDDIFYDYKAADQNITSSSSSLTDVTDLQFTLPAGETWGFDMTIFTGDIDDVQTNGFQFQVTCSGATGRWGIVSEENGDSRAIGSPYVSPAYDHPASQPIFVLQGAATGGASAATCKFQASHGGDPAGPDPYAIRAFSNIRAWKIA